MHLKKYSLNKILMLGCFFYLGSFFFAQNNFSISIPWTESMFINDGNREILVPNIQNQSLNGREPSFYWKEKSSKGKKIQLISFDSENISGVEKEYADEFLHELPNNPQIDYKITKGGKDWFAVVSAKPFYKVNNQIKKVTKLHFEISENSDVTVIQKDFVANSALREGTGIWYKIAVEKDGIYKIDKSFLEGCGINTNGLNPDHIHIFGNGEGMLPENNSVPRLDDLVENSIYVKGDTDGKFDEGDYLMFYAWGPIVGTQMEMPNLNENNMYIQINLIIL